MEYPIICPNCEDKFGNCWYGPIEPPSRINWACRLCETTGLIENPQRCSSIIINQENLHRDKRGDIWKIMSINGFKTYLRITTEKGEVRGQHFHKRDFHACFLESGKLKYTERLTSTDEMKSWIIVPGQTVLTPPLIDHAFEALEDSVMYTYSTEEERSHENYEKDTVRIKLI